MGSSQPASPALHAQLHLSKTPQAYNSLQLNVRGELSLLQRRALILADGQRNVQALCALLGPNSQAVLEQLYHRGYLHEQGNSSLACAAPAVLSTGKPAPRPTRTFSAARDHLLAVVQEHPEPVARGWEWQLQQASEGEAGLRTLACVLDALSPAIGERAARQTEQQLPQLLPYEQLQRLQQLRQSTVKPADRPLQHLWY